VKPAVSIVIPVYGNEATVPALIERLDGYAAQLAPARMEAVFVIDGSPDRSGERIRELLPTATFDAQLVWHARNFGAFAAIRTGLEAAAGDAIAVMAADLQEPAETILQMLAPVRAGTADVVLATRTGRDDSWSVRVTSAAFWRTYRRLVQRDAPAGGVDMFACTTAVRDVLVSLRESNTSLVGLLMWAGYRREVVEYRRQARADGESGWTFRRRVRYMLDSVYSFTDLPITAIITVGMIGIIGSFIAAIVVFAAWVSGRIDIQGYTPLMMLLLALTSTVLFAPGVIGSYVWRTYENSKARPLALVRVHEQFTAREP
jgi:glycosyltransferase involved in cell wall biosynthesis